MAFRIVDTSPQSLYVLNTFLTRMENTLYNFDGRGIKAKSIKAKSIDVDTLFVGTGGIKLDATATILWDQVTGDNKPDLSKYVDTLTFNSALSDKVTTTDLTTTLTNYVTDGTMSNALNDLANNSNLATLIGYDFVTTGKILANQIAAGLISGCTLKTADTNYYATVQNQYIDLWQNSTSWLRVGYDYIPVYGKEYSVLTPFVRLGNSSINANIYSDDYSLFIDTRTLLAGTDGTGKSTKFTGDVYANGTKKLATQDWVSANAPAPDLSSYISFSGSVTTLTDGAFIDTTEGYARFQKDASNYIKLGTNICTFVFTDGSLCDIKSDGFYVNGTKVGTGSVSVIPVFA